MAFATVAHDISIRGRQRAPEKLESKGVMWTPTVTTNSMATMDSDGDDDLKSGGKLGGGAGLSYGDGF
ncbi:hypothetical protein Droror1_Dr00014243 [Drosera rotundifolia]